MIASVEFFSAKSQFVAAEWCRTSPHCSFLFFGQYVCDICVPVPKFRPINSTYPDIIRRSFHHPSAFRLENYHVFAGAPATLAMLLIINIILPSNVQSMSHADLCSTSADNQRLVFILIGFAVRCLAWLREMRDRRYRLPAHALEWKPCTLPRSE